VSFSTFSFREQLLRNYLKVVLCWKQSSCDVIAGRSIYRESPKKKHSLRISCCRAQRGSTLFLTRGGFSRVHSTQSFARSMYCRDPRSRFVSVSFSYPEPILRAVNGARQGALAKSISNWHLIGYNNGYCSNTGYILLPCFHGIRLWIWPESLVAPRVRKALGTRMCLSVKMISGRNN
jgi:hypothetical protein